MRWFKKKATPFDDNFEIHIERPADHGGLQELLFEVPYNYYAQVISFTLTLDPPLLVAFNENYIYFKVTRGGVVIYICNSEGALNHGGPPFMSGGGVGIGSAMASIHGSMLGVKIPEHCYVYPHDEISVYMPHKGDNFTLSDLVVVMKIWRTD